VASRKSKKQEQLRTSKETKPLRKHTEEAIGQYLANLNGERPHALYDFVIGEVEGPLLKAVMAYTRGNQSEAAGILGINRGTLRKKLKTYSLLQ
jgi:Fis family transcriptional regulator